MKEYTVRLIIEYSTSAVNEEQAEERAQPYLDAAVDNVFLERRRLNRRPFDISDSRIEIEEE